MARSSAENPRLSASECWRLLEGQKVGRLSVIGTDGMPDIFPVNFVSFQGSIYIRTAPDIKVVAVTSHPFAAFEVDGETDEGWWSVVVRGGASVVRDPVELERAGVTRLSTASPRHKQHGVKLLVNTINGRRFAHRDANVPAATRPAAPPESPPEVDTQPHRGARPEKIASLPPLEEGTGASSRRSTP